MQLILTHALWCCKVQRLKCLPHRAAQNIHQTELDKAVAYTLISPRRIPCLPFCLFFCIRSTPSVSRDMDRSHLAAEQAAREEERLHQECTFRPDLPTKRAADAAEAAAGAGWGGAPRTVALSVSTPPLGLSLFAACEMKR